MSRLVQLQARKDAAENRIMTIHNEILILDRQIDEAEATVNALEHDWEVLQEENTAAQIDAREAIEEIQRLTRNNPMGGSRCNRTRRRSRK
jgi:multidrug resistance efflux pump